MTDPFAMLVELVARRTAELVLERLGERQADAKAPAALLSKQSLASALSVSPASVDRLVRDGRIPFVRVGDVRRFDLAAVRAALETAAPTERAASPTASPVRLLSRALAHERDALRDDLATARGLLGRWLALGVDVKVIRPIELDRATRGELEKRGKP